MPFLSTPSARRATPALRRCGPDAGISIHALREEGDRAAQRRRMERMAFLSTPSARRATGQAQRGEGAQLYFYPRPPRGGRPRHDLTLRSIKRISIHALREEGDIVTPLYHPTKKISIHALREEGDCLPSADVDRMQEFLSTPSARRATRRTDGHWLRDHFYPRPPRGGRRLLGQHGVILHTEFLSTPSARRATTVSQYESLWQWISIHALREEGDGTVRRRRGRDGPISIHALREEGDGPLRPVAEKYGLFLSTPSARRATRAVSPYCRQTRNFYPRPPRGGRRCTIRSGYFVKSYFYPRPPRGGRRRSHRRLHTAQHISIHALREEGDILGLSTGAAARLFLSTPSARRATVFSWRCYPGLETFLSTPSARRATVQSALVT